MARKRIMKIVNIDGIGVPVDNEGRYLDWRRIKGEYAEVLSSSPHGTRRFVLGDATASIVLDFGVLPNGYYAITADPEHPKIDLHCEDQYIIHTASEVADAVYHLTLHCIESLERCGVKCENPWAFMKAVKEHAGAEIV